MNVLIVGGGRLGVSLAGLLIAGGHQVRLVARPEELEKTQPDLSDDVLVKGRRTDPDVLEGAGIRRADVLVAVTDSDETNLVVTSLARFEFKVPRTIARINNPDNAWMFTPVMGVDAALNQAELMAHLVAEEMSLGEMMTLLKLRKGQYSLVEEKVHPEAPAAGKRISELGLPEGCVLLAVIRDGNLKIPTGSTGLRAEDEVVALVDQAKLGQLAAILGTGEHRAG